MSAKSSEQYIEFSGAENDDADGTITEFAADDEDENSTGVNGTGLASSLRLPNPNADKPNRQKPLEGLLMSKNRKLQDGMTKLRVRVFKKSIWRKH